MSSQVKEKSEVSAKDLLQMQTRLRMMTTEYEKLSRENSELRSRLHSLSDERLLQIEMPSFRHKRFLTSKETKIDDARLTN